MIIPVPAGAQVTAEFHHTLAGADPSDSADPIDPSHKGPILAYLCVNLYFRGTRTPLRKYYCSAPVANATQTTVTGLNWFKIYQDGLDSGTWAVDKLITNKGKVTFTIPSCIPAGQYLLRVEIIGTFLVEYPGNNHDAIFFFFFLRSITCSLNIPRCSTLCNIFNDFSAARLRLIYFQMECAQIAISGGGSASPATVSFPGAYKCESSICTIANECMNRRH